VFDAFMPVFCVLTMQVLEGVVSYVTDEGVRVHGASYEERMLLSSTWCQ
jgi:hypothetical protein